MPPPHQTASLRSWGTLSPGPPHLRRAAPCSAPGRPSTPQARRPLQPARGHSELPGPAPPPPSRRPRPRPAPARPEWAVHAERGRGPRGVPAPGRGDAQAPHVTRARQGARRGCTVAPRIPPRVAPRLRLCWVTRSARDSSSGSWSIPAGARGPAATGHCSSTKSQGAAPAPPPPLL